MHTHKYKTLDCSTNECTYCEVMCNYDKANDFFESSIKIGINVIHRIDILIFYQVVYQNCYQTSVRVDFLTVD
jgi:hypothetical protein